MTCIVGFTDRKSVWIGGDSAGVSNYRLHVRSDPKVFRNGDFLFGFTSSFRMGQLLQYALKPPVQHGGDTLRWLATEFVDAVRKCLKDGGFATKDKEAESAGTFLLGYRSGLYLIDSDYQVGVPAEPFHAVGCGADVALGAMYASRGSPPHRIRQALRASERFSAGVRATFVVKKLTE